MHPLVLKVFERATPCPPPVCRESDKEMLTVEAQPLRDMRELTATVNVYRDLLLELLPQLDAATQLVVKETLASNEKQSQESKLDEMEITGSAGSPRLQDRIQDDMGVQGRSIGFLGKSSAIRWMEEIVEKVLTREPNTPARYLELLDKLDQTGDREQFSRLLASSCVYYLDDMDLDDFGAFGENVNAFQLPQRAVADALLDSYLATVHPFFPVIDEEEFREQYERYWSIGSPLTEDILIWIATLNVIFSLGEVCAQALEMEWRGKLNDHTLYYIRSRLVLQDFVHTLDGTDLNHIKLDALTGMYFFASNQMNRAWHTTGTGVLQAYTLGLHLKSVDLSVAETQHEMEMRIWHSLASLETQLCCLTGRPTGISERAVSTGMPRPIHIANTPAHSKFEEVASSVSDGRTSDEAQTSPLRVVINPFKSTVELDAILSETLTYLYSASTVALRWFEIQQIVERMNSKLARWSAVWSPLFKDVLRQRMEQTPQVRSQVLHLQIRCYSISILINRPCLCGTDDGLSSSMPDQSAGSRHSDELAAARCVSSAQSLVRLLRKESDKRAFYTATPWWSILHYLVQAAAILTIEIVYAAVHVPGQMDSLAADAVMVLQWLQAMATTNASAELAWLALSRLIQLGLAKNDRDVDLYARFMPPDLAIRPPVLD
ncbi:C6 transcription factor [Paecilomyces variotii No. 5]|uniref:C6 transcription factor n=1 Tax=Byssochlamys spectabilis (strain No. 5 / NBRC 109023) TaxID=1356009 RepID=V5FLW3_BYSSN|nr:C6 transcription factor [Paecilomyces variotii No. 5]